jgi:hypothetical protein
LNFQDFKEKVEFNSNSKIVHCKKFNEIYGIVCLLKGDSAVYDCSTILSENTTFNDALQMVTNKINAELMGSNCLDEFH